MIEKERKVINEFHNIYYDGLQSQGQIFLNTFWMGVPCLKCPLDLWVYQEILFQIKPDLIIETGTNAGGSALFLAHMCDLIGTGHIATIDITDQPRPSHQRITYILGSSADKKTIDKALFCCETAKTIMVILDSDHSESHVSKELELLAPLVTVGSYVIVEDTNINGHPAYPSFGLGPHEAVQKFMKNNKNFEIDLSKEKFLMTFNPNGFLKRIS